MMTEFSLGEAIAVLARTPATMDAMLRGLTDKWVHSNEGENTWSAFDIVGHLIVGERTDWMPRVRIILQNGEARAFDPFDRFAQSRESGQISRAAVGRFCAAAERESGCSGDIECTAGRFNSTRPASSAGSGDAIGTTRDVGGPRPYPFASAVPRDGLPVSRCGRPVERVSGRVAMCRS